MLFLLSPAKKLDYDSPLATSLHSDPLFVDESKGLIEVLKAKSADEVAGLMSLSQSLAEMNVERYQQWTPRFSLHNARPAALAFNGDVYEGLQASDLSDKDLQWAQEHVAILSGLYGVLRPLDLMQPYRLEMGTRLENSKGKNLYEYWKDVVSPYLNSRLAKEKDPVIINLASDEYFKVVDLKTLNARVIQCVFQDQKAGQWKIISFYAKRARGLMARYAIKHRVNRPEQLQSFDSEGYVFAPDLSSQDKLVFRRPENWESQS
ncbi:peroxide stress protein YaaA [Orrella marina]|uniref:UPF0246 protein DBV39_10865 n=1 Tax=Orrella marina TaxID=2163011 RepID=A0A2R4XK29_9BURK|nr:peroxide stress protein YaaA [Orrella marina]AWB34128.1 peroxide stress protein YaaA [Orrella marina]